MPESPTARTSQRAARRLGGAILDDGSAYERVQREVTIRLVVSVAICRAESHFNNCEGLAPRYNRHEELDRAFAAECEQAARAHTK